jgi:hypothetical protein
MLVSLRKNVILFVALERHTGPRDSRQADDFISRQELPRSAKPDKADAGMSCHAMDRFIKANLVVATDRLIILDASPTVRRSARYSPEMNAAAAGRSLQ